MINFTQRYVNTISIIISIILFYLINFYIISTKEIDSVSINSNQEQIQLEQEKDFTKETTNKESTNENEFNSNDKSTKESNQKTANWRIEIPIIGLNAPIAEGTTQEIMNEYVGHFEETNKTNGNIGLAAHNRGYNVYYFQNLKKLKEGDEIFYYCDGI